MAFGGHEPIVKNVTGHISVYLRLRMVIFPKLQFILVKLHEGHIGY